MDDDLQLLRDVRLSTRNKTRYRPADPLNDYPDDHFKQRYRMYKSSFEDLFDLIKEDLVKENSRGCPVDSKKQLLIAIRFYATGLIQRDNGDILGISQATTCRIIGRVSRLIAKLYPKFIKWPETSEAPAIAQGFLHYFKKTNPSKPGLPNVIGAIDGTHIRVAAKGVPNRERYRNRYQEMSINVQAVCKANLLFTDVVARWPGSTHDSRVFTNSAIYCKLAKGQHFGYWLVGDKGYGCKPFIMTPVSSKNNLTPAEERFNFTQSSTRNHIERSFGVLKKRFACLGGAGLQLSLANSLPTIVACFVLHNFLIIKRDFLDDEQDDSDFPLAPINVIATATRNNPGPKYDTAAAGFKTRKHLVETIFN